MIAITGAAGFIGANLAHRLASQGHDLLLVDHPLAADKAANLVGLRQFRFVEHEPFLSLLEAGELKLDGIFHLGACSRTTETDWDYLLRNNVGYSQHIWQWTATQACPLIYASSAATYGDGSQGFDDRIPPEKLHPLNLYGKSKNEFDAWVLGQVREGRPAPPVWSGLKFFNVYGPREFHKGSMASVIWQSYKQIIESGEVRLFRSTDPNIADGQQRRDFVFVDDCIDHMLWLWRRPEASGIYNSGTGKTRSFLDLANATFAALGRQPLIRFVDMPEKLRAQYQNFTQADMSRLLSTGYTAPATSLEEGTLRYVKFLESRSRANV